MRIIKYAWMDADAKLMKRGADGDHHSPSDPRAGATAQLASVQIATHDQYAIGNVDDTMDGDDGPNIVLGREPPKIAPNACAPPLSLTSLTF